MLLVCEPDGRLRGMVTDRDIVVKVVAAGRPPVEVAVGDLADQPEVVTIGADDTVDEAIETMKRHKVRRLPVIDGHAVVGILSQGDIARSQPDGAVGRLLGGHQQLTPRAGRGRANCSFVMASANGPGLTDTGPELAPGREGGGAAL